MLVFVVVCMLVFVVVRVLVFVTENVANRPVDLYCVEEGRSQTDGQVPSAGVWADVARLG